MARSSSGRARPRRRSRSAASGGSGQPASSRRTAAAAWRRDVPGGLTSSTVAPVMAGPPVMTLAAPGSRSSSRSATCSGSGSRRLSRANGPPSGRTRAAVLADPMCTVTWRGSRGSGPSCQARGGPASLMSIVAVSVQPPGSTSAIPRAS